MINNKRVDGRKTKSEAIEVSIETEKKLLKVNKVNNDEIDLTDNILKLNAVNATLSARWELILQRKC